MRTDIDELDFDDDYIYKLNGHPYTGVAFESSPCGDVLSETAFSEGVQDGLSSEWFSNGHLHTESNYKKGAKHGISKEWFEDGTQKSESFFEFGILVKETEWDSQGGIVKQYEISPDEPSYKTLEEFRRF